MPQLSAKARAQLRNAAFAYVDSKGRRRLPIHDEAHVRNALARFNQTRFEDDAARERARRRLLTAAKKFGRRAILGCSTLPAAPCTSVSTPLPCSTKCILRS